MSHKKKSGYSVLIRPLLYLIDILIINSILYFVFSEEVKINTYFNLYISLSWIIISFSTKFYHVYRYSTLVSILSLIFNQIILFAIVILAYFGLNQSFNLILTEYFKYIVSVFVIICLIKWGVFFLLKKYRVLVGSNFRRTIIVGSTSETNNLIDFFKKRPDYGYKFYGFFTDKKKRGSLGEYKDIFEFVIQNNIDEIYCSLSELKNKQIKKLIEFSDNNGVIIKFIPDSNILFAKKTKLQFYDFQPILFLREIPLDDSINSLIKRIFDIVFSLIIIIFLLSWLLPIIGIIILVESKGPVFFKQPRPGMNGEEFNCIKLRSMKVNSDSQTAANRNDNRITRVGNFIRKTSIDELPQFFNVLKGDMSIVGPRPHPMTMTNEFSKNINKFNVRHFVKPGITGLSQVQGNRGEIEADVDIIHRVKYDIFYIENWTFFLDIKIILQTVINAIKGEDKAY